MLNITENLDPTTAMVVILVSLASLAIVILNRSRLPRWLHIGVATMATVVLCVAALDLIFGPKPSLEEELLVQAGDTLIIGPDRLNLRVNNWVMEDGSTIRIPSDVCGEGDCTWSIQAKKATFGKDVRILGVGEKGEDGDRPGRLGATATQSGGNGGHGGPGKRRVTRGKWHQYRPQDGVGVHR